MQCQCCGSRIVIPVVYDRYTGHTGRNTGSGISGITILDPSCGTSVERNKRRLAARDRGKKNVIEGRYAIMGYDRRRPGIPTAPLDNVIM